MYPKESVIISFTNILNTYARVLKSIRNSKVKKTIALIS